MLLWVCLNGTNPRNRRKDKLEMLRKLNAVLVLMNTSSSPFSTAAVFAATSTWQTITKEFCRMKRPLLCALLTAAMACGGTALYAQQDTMSQSGPPQQHRPPVTADQRLQYLTKQLNLTSDQQDKIKPILESENSQMQTLRQDTTTSRDEKMAKMHEIRQGADDQIKALLTPDQQQKFTQMQNRQMEHHGGAMQGPGL
jgi:periplasmic protein CpxP/Spy